jgi:hypothetical protein
MSIDLTKNTLFKRKISGREIRLSFVTGVETGKGQGVGSCGLTEFGTRVDADERGRRANFIS